jgi:hypothetical protein
MPVLAGVLDCGVVLLYPEAAVDGAATGTTFLKVVTEEAVPEEAVPRGMVAVVR